ncbi:glycine reductase [Fusibacter tunisiensis]|nr:glycine reductase [Fusibacter tunisiensis]
MAKARVVHYINQFFAGIGGEEKADIKPQVLSDLPPISVQLNKLLGEDAEIVSCVVCGDSYFNENLDQAKTEVLALIKTTNPEFVIAGPAFNAGRYGMACGTVVQMVEKELSIKAITAMYEENPGVDVFKKDILIVRTSDSAAGMRKALPAVAKFALKCIAGETLLEPDVEGYIPRGLRVNAFTEERGSMRAVRMLVQKLKGETFKTEYPMPAFDRVPANPAVADITKAKIAIVTSGGIVPKHNPDRIESSSASKYGKYSIAGFDAISEADHETAHGGYDPVYANLDPNRVIPVDVLRDMEKSGEIGSLFDYFYTTVGNGTSVANSVKYAAEIAKDLLANNVDAVILTST